MRRGHPDVPRNYDSRAKHSTESYFFFSPVNASRGWWCRGARDGRTAEECGIRHGLLCTQSSSMSTSNGRGWGKKEASRENDLWLEVTGSSFPFPEDLRPREGRVYPKLVPENRCTTDRHCLDYLIRRRRNETQVSQLPGLSTVVYSLLLRISGSLSALVLRRDGGRSLG